jgi:hypothetical protein
LPGRDVVERLLGEQHQSREPFRTARRGDLRTTPVDGDEDQVVEADPLDELGEQIRERVQREIGIGVHGPPVTAEWEHRDNAPVRRSQPGDHGMPQRGVHDEPAGEHDHRTPIGVFVPAGVLVVDRPARELHGLHRYLPYERRVERSL